MRLVAAFAFLCLLSSSTAILNVLGGGSVSSGGLLGGGVSGSASGGLTASLGAALSGVQADLNALLNAVASIAANANVDQALRNALNTVKNIVSTAVGSITGLLNGGALSVVSEVGSIVQGIVGEIQGTVNAAINLLVGADLSGSGNVGNLLGQVISALGSLSSSVGGIVNGNVGAVITPLRNVIQRVIALVNSLGSNPVGAVSQAVTQLLQVISNTVNNVVRGVVGTVRGATSGTGGLLGGLLTSVTSLLNDLLGGLVPGLLNNVLSIANGLTGSLGLLGGGGGGLLGGGSSGGALGLNLNLNDLLGQVTNTLGGTLGTVRGLLSNVVGTLDGITGGALGEVLGTVAQLLEPVIETLRPLIDQLLANLDDVGSQLGLNLNSLRGALDNLLSNVQVALRLLEEGNIDAALNVIIDSLDDVVVYVQATLDGAGAITPNSPLGQIVGQVQNLLAQVLGTLGPALGIEGDLLDTVLNTVRRLLAALGGSGEGSFDFRACGNVNAYLATAIGASLNADELLRVATGLAEIGSSIIGVGNGAQAALLAISSGGVQLVRSLTNNAVAYLQDVITYAAAASGSVTAGANVNVGMQLVSSLQSLQAYAAANTNVNGRFVIVFRDSAASSLNAATVTQIQSILTTLRARGINVILVPTTQGAASTALNLLSSAQQQLLAQIRNASGLLDVNLFAQFVANVIIGRCQQG